MTTIPCRPRMFTALAACLLFLSPQWTVTLDLLDYEIGPVCTVLADELRSHHCGRLSTTFLHLLVHLILSLWKVNWRMTSEPRHLSHLTSLAAYPLHRFNYFRSRLPYLLRYPLLRLGCRSNNTRMNTFPERNHHHTFQYLPASIQAPVYLIVR